MSDIAASLIAHAAAHDPAVRAWRCRDDDAVLARAADLDRSAPGPLTGVMAGVKDLIDTADLPTGYGSELFDGHRPAVDAPVVAALRAAAVTVLGKTESTEFALFRPTRTRNPVDPARTPGGSSSGSAAAVAAGMAQVALGTQTAGSVVRPAAYCGVYGYKPAIGWASTEGIWRLAEHLDTVGLFARRAADLALLHGAAALATAAGARPRPGRGRPAPGAVAVLDTTPWGPVTGDVDAAVRRVADRLADAGWAVEGLAMPSTWLHLPEAHETIMAVEVARNLRAALGDRLASASPAALAVVARGDQTPPAAYHDALAAVADARRALGATAPVVDVIVCPSAPSAAPLGLDATGDPVMCRAATALGLPAANLPYVRRADGLPVGVQAIAPGGDDAAFLADLLAIEGAFDEAEVAPFPPGL
ncbi:MAG TPA: amidase [Acidimicrobiales bacterium]|nr:amidase [Acidimicrobiales bacterium]